MTKKRHFGTLKMKKVIFHKTARHVTLRMLQTIVKCIIFGRKAIEGVQRACEMDRNSVLFDAAARDAICCAPKARQILRVAHAMHRDDLLRTLRAIYDRSRWSLRIVASKSALLIDVRRKVAG